jgi:major membrane immunogen (membrane-anchored lipoprotein)
MRAIVVSALVLGLCGVAGAKDEKADPVGTWKLEYEIGDGQKREATLTVKKDGDKLAGMVTFQDKQEAKLKDPALKDGVLTFSVDRELKDMKLTVAYKLTVEGDAIKGKGAVEVGGEKREFDIAGKREKK